MHHNYDVDIEKDAYGYLVRCYECGKEFDAKRYDSAFCSSTCRSRNHRKKGKTERDLNKATDLIRDLIKRMPDTGESDIYVKLNELSAEIERALAWVEVE